MSRQDPKGNQVLQVLKENHGQFVSGISLANRLGISRTAVWKHIRSLKAQGYHILSHPKTGYSLVHVPDLLTPEEILPLLRTAWLGRDYHYIHRVSSTNDAVLRIAADGGPHGATVVAEEQTQGRGRLRRPWISPPGTGIYVSFLLTTPIPVRNAPLTTLVAALALTRVIRRDYALPAAIKWPNDVLIGSRKLSGILTEIQSDQELTKFIVIGVGINVSQTAADLSGEFRYPPTSIALEAGRPVSRKEVLLSFLAEFETQFAVFLEKGFSSLLGELEAVSAILGKNITIHSGNVETYGRVSGFTPDGALRLLTGDGREETFWVGDITRVEGNF